MSGMVKIEPTVVMNVISVMRAGFLPYFMQNIVPNEATGMAMTTVLISFTMSLTPHTLKRKYSDTGTTPRRTTDATKFTGNFCEYGSKFQALNEAFNI